MSSKTVRKKRRFLKSKVARRVLLMFVVCSMLPIGCLWYLGYRSIATQLRTDAERRLDRDTKSAGNVFIDSLQTTERELEFWVDRMAALGTDDLSAVKIEKPRRRVWHESFDRWLTVNERSERLAGSTDEIVCPLLDEEHLRHLRTGNAVVLPSRSGKGSSGVLLGRAIVRGKHDLSIVFVEPRSDAIYDADDFEFGTAFLSLRFENGPELVGQELLPANLGRFGEGENRTGRTVEWTKDGETYASHFRIVFTKPRYLENFVIVLTEPESSMLKPLLGFNRIFLPSLLLVFFLVIQISIVQIRRSLVPIEKLQDATKKMTERDFSVRVSIDTQDEFGELGQSFNHMVEKIERNDEVDKILMDIGVALTSEKSIEKLVETVMKGAGRICRSDGQIYLSATSDGALELRAFRSDASKKHWSSFRSENSFDAVPIRIVEGKDELVAQAVVVNEASELSKDLSAVMDRLDRRLGAKTKSLMVLPLRDRSDDALGCLILCNSTQSPNKGFEKDDFEHATSLASQASAAIANHKWVQEFRNLFDSLSELIATAIDEKSPYTGGHCRRVPIITMMIADAIMEDGDGAFKAVEFTEEELYELKIAALLHDCGKVATPVHVVDKATKLETIFDRIHLLDARLEIIKRDLEIKAIKASPQETLAPSAGVFDLADEIKKVEDARAFLKKCNIGGEFMTKDAQQRVKDLAATYSFADPCGHLQPLLSAEEVANLSIARGTLNSDEREIINRHVVSTIRMLEKLPYPRALKNVPKIAGAHHERCDGKGYPHGLKKGDICLQGRILGLADIFEALTAKDRPYKPGKKLSESMEILGRMRLEGHIDPDLFRLFIDKEVYLRYGREYLDPEQVDEVVVERIPGYKDPEPAVV